MINICGSAADGSNVGSNVGNGGIGSIGSIGVANDPNYRYKMPPVQLHVDHKKRRTVICNIHAIGKALQRDVGEIVKFMAHDIGTKVQVKVQQGGNGNGNGNGNGKGGGVGRGAGVAVVGGIHADVVLQSSIQRYIETFVLCYECGLPETIYQVKRNKRKNKKQYSKNNKKNEKDNLWYRCEACGANEMVDDMGSTGGGDGETSRKLCNYICTQYRKMMKKKEDDSSDSGSSSGSKSSSSSGSGKEKAKPKDKTAKEGKKSTKEREKKKKDKEKGKKKASSDGGEEFFDDDTKIDDISAMGTFRFFA